MRWAWAIAIFTAALLAVPPGALAKRPRPTDVPPGVVFSELAPNALHVFNDYATPSRFYESRRAVVHYVVLGIDAPPLNDDDGDGVPDYVHRVGDAADTAIAYYERRGFTPIRADAAGPDARPDLYISRFTPGCFGIAFPATRAEGGAFVALSNALDPSPEVSLGSLYGTVAHELFHLVQFSYSAPTSEPDLADWALEGMASALESRVYPDLDDIVSSLQLRPWFAAPSRSVTRQSYGAQLLWRYLDERRPRLLPAYLARGVADPRGARLVSTYERLAHAPFRAEFARFALWAGAEYGDRITPVRRLERRAHAAGFVAPLAIDYLRLSRSTRSVSVRFAGEAALTYELESDRPGEPPTIRRLRPPYVIPAALRRNERFVGATLVLANGSPARSVRYRIETR